MARPKFCVRGPSPTHPARTWPGAEGKQGVTASIQEKNEQVAAGNSTASVVVQDHIRPLRPQLRADRQVKTEQSFNPALGEKLPPETPISATISRTISAAKVLQATAPAVWPGTPPEEKELSHDEWMEIVESGLEEENQPANQSLSPAAPASPSISTPAVVGNKPRAARGLELSHADLVSDAHLRLKEKAEKLGVSATFFKIRRKNAGLGRWQGRQVRAGMKGKEAQARRA